MTEKEIIKYYDGIWWLISCHKYLSEEFIEKHSDKVYWHLISCHQKLSSNFIKDFMYEVYLDKIPMAYFPNIKPKYYSKAAHSWKTFL
jgi:hypothetical protein